jgi:hypothetical protein
MAQNRWISVDMGIDRRRGLDGMAHGSIEDMKPCPACQRDVSDEAKECPYCGVVFAKWKERKSQPTTAPALQANTTDEQTEEDQSDFYPLPPLSPSERDDLIRIKQSFDEKPEAKAFCRSLEVHGILTEIRYVGEWGNVYNVYVPRKHLFPVIVIRKLHAKRHTLTELAKQPMPLRQVLLLDAMVETAQFVDTFKRSLFPDQTLVWFQAYAKMNEEQMRATLSMAPQAYQTTTRWWIIGSGIIGATCVLIGWAGWKSEDKSRLLLLLVGLGIVIFGLKKLVNLVLSEKEWV